MIAHLVLTLAAAHAVLATPAAPRSDVLRTIESRHAAGRIDASTRHYWTLCALRDPSCLPADLRDQLDRSPPRAGCFTRQAMEAYRAFRDEKLAGTGLGPRIPDHDRLLLPPDDLQFCTDSQSYPFRVCWDNPADDTKAQAVLQATETAWALTIDTWGFYPPEIEPPHTRYRIFIDSTGMGGGGFTAPYDTNPNTPRTDCYSYIVIDRNNPLDSIGDTSAHELNHASQIAMDCQEVTAFLENTSTYIASQVFAEATGYAIFMMRFFQENPWRSIDYMVPGQSDLSEYGGNLWLVYLTDTYASQDGPEFVAEIWQRAIQDGFANEPDYYDVIAEMVAERGGPGWEGLIADFAEARYFVGGDDDGRHISGAGGFWGAELVVSEDLSFGDLPVIDQTPPTSTLPAPYGSNYLRLTLPPGYAIPIRVGIRGDPESRWAARVVPLLGPEPTPSIEIPLGAAGLAGDVLVETEGYRRLLLIVTNLTDGTYDPDARAWPQTPFTYTFAPEASPPLVTRVEPARLSRGQQNVRLFIYGENFLYGGDFDVTFPDPLISVVSVDSVDATLVQVTVTVPLSTELGFKDVTVINTGGAEGTGNDLLEIVEFDDGSKKGGCSCGASGAGEGWPGAAAFALVGLLWLFRRRRPRSLPVR